MIPAKAAAKTTLEIMLRTTAISVQISIARERFLRLILLSLENAQTSIIMNPTKGLSRYEVEEELSYRQRGVKFVHAARNSARHASRSVCSLLRRLRIAVLTALIRILIRSAGVAVLSSSLLILTSGSGLLNISLLHRLALLRRLRLLLRRRLRLLGLLWRVCCGAAACWRRAAVEVAPAVAFRLWQFIAAFDAESRAVCHIMSAIWAFHKNIPPF